MGRCLNEEIFSESQEISRRNLYIGSANGSYI